MCFHLPTGATYVSKRFCAVSSSLLFIACATVQRSGPPPGCIKMECAELFEGLKPLDPQADEDNDGVRNEIDGAPTIPEDKDGFQDEDGIPDPEPAVKEEPKSGGGETPGKSPKEDTKSQKVSDLDKDTFADAYDQCINEAEDLDGFEDDDGCPERDNDGDGTLDADDPCPNIPGTWCTAEKPKPTPVAANPTAAPSGEKEKLEVKDEVIFAAGSAKLDFVKSAKALKQLVQALKDRPELRIEIRGHTDNSIKEDVAKKLSFSRANAVRSYLVKMKIAQDRLVAVGMGSSEPLEPNDTAAGRAKNRRVEFVVLQ